MLTCHCEQSVAIRQHFSIIQKVSRNLTRNPSKAWFMILIELRVKYLMYQIFDKNKKADIIRIDNFTY